MFDHARKLLTFDFWLDVRVIGILLMVLALSSATFGYVRVHGDFDLLTILGDFYANVSAELGSIAITVLIIDTVNRRYDARQRLRETKERLVHEAGSSSHGVAVTAVNTLRKRGWLGRENKAYIFGDTLSLLQGADLSGANLQGVNLMSANLQNTDLNRANLMHADLNHAHFTGGRLDYANLRGAIIDAIQLERTVLNGANLFAAELMRADLTNCDLQNTDLSHADLRGANLCGANLARAKMHQTLLDNHTQFDEETRLPDGTNWSAHISLIKFDVELRAITNVQTELFGKSHTYTFADGTQRRWKLGEGWLD